MYFCELSKKEIEEIFDIKRLLRKNILLTPPHKKKFGLLKYHFFIKKMAKLFSRSRYAYGMHA